jgi:hypothetical protein
MAQVGEAQRAVRAERRKHERGLIIPNPGIARLTPFPGVMADPPTVTQGASGAASAITTLNGAVGAGVDLNATIGDNGSPTSATSTTLTDTGKSWSSFDFTGYVVKIWSGTGVGQERTIRSNTNNTLTVDAWATIPDGTSVYGFWHVREHRDWRYLNANPIVKVADPGASNFTRDRNDVVASAVASVLPTGSMNMVVEFMHWGDQFEVRTHGTAGNQWRLMVDGAYVQRTPYAATASTSAVFRHRVDFADGETNATTRATFRQLRRIVLELPSGFGFYGVTLGPTDSVWTPSTPARPKVVLVTDSYGNTGSQAAFTSFGYTLGRLLGIPDMQVSGIGGSGYSVDGTGVKYGTRYQQDVIDEAPDLVMIYGSQNDSGQATTQADADAVFQAHGAGLPGVPLVVIGPSPLSGSPSAITIQSRDRLMAAAIDLDNPVSLYIDLLGGPYPYSGSTAAYVNKGLFRGTGKPSAPTNSGNNDDFYGGTSGSDQFHPSQAGHDAIAQFVAHAMAEWIDADCPRAYWMPGVGLVDL